MRSSVDFPLPFGPTSAVTQPGRISRPAPCTTSVSPYATVMPRASRADAAGDAGAGSGSAARAIGAVEAGEVTQVRLA